MKKIIITLLSCFLVTAIDAQRITQNFRNVSLSEALTTISKQSKTYKVNFIFNELEDFTVTTSIQKKDVLDAIRQVIGFYPMRLVIDGDNVFIECTQKEKKKLTGVVVDSIGKPVIYANISLLSERDSSFITGGVSNESGRFVIPCERKKVIVRISSVGYKPFVRSTNVGDMGRVTMLPDAIMIQGVTVKSDRPATRLTPEGFTTQVFGTLLSDLGTAADVLGQIPRVSGDGGNFTVFGKGTPVIYINGKKVNDNNELQRLSSTEIKSVDVITSPGARYSAEAKAVIRIHTMKQQGSGLSGNIYSSYGNNHKNQWYEQPSLNYRAGGLDIFGKFSYSRTFGGQEQTLVSSYQGNTANIVKKNVTSIGNTDSWINAYGGFNYQANDNHSFGVTYSYSKNVGNPIAKMKQTYTITEDGEHVADVDYYDKEKSRADEPSNEINAYYEGQVGKLGIDFNGTVLWKKDLDMQDTEENNSATGINNVYSTSTNKYNLYAGKLELEYPFSDGLDLTFGSEVTYTDNKAVFNNEQSFIASSDDHIKESNIAAFAELEWEINNFNFNVGVRYEHVKSDYYSYGVWQDDESRIYDNVFPDIQLYYGNEDFQTAISASAKTSRPEYDQLSGYIRYDDAYLYEGGNPTLQPTYVYNADWDVVYKWMSLSVSYQYFKDYIADYMRMYDTYSNIVIAGNDNINHIQILSASFAAQPEIGFWHPTFEVSYQQQLTDMKRYGVASSLRKPLFKFDLNNNFILPHSFVINLSYMYATTNDWCFTRAYKQQMLNFSVTKKLLKDNLTLRFYANDIFRSQRDSFTMYSSIGTAKKRGIPYNRMVGVSVNYKFNAAGSKYKGTGAGESEKSRM